MVGKRLFRQGCDRYKYAMNCPAPEKFTPPPATMWRSLALSVLFHGLVLSFGSDYWHRSLPPRAKASPPRITATLVERLNPGRPPVTPPTDSKNPDTFLVPGAVGTTDTPPRVEDSGPGFAETPDFSRAESVPLNRPFSLRIRIRVSEQGHPEIELSETPQVSPEYLLAILEALTSARYSPAIKNGKPARGHFELIIQGAPLVEGATPTMIRPTNPAATEN